MSRERGAVARGMVLGEDEAIDPLLRDDFRRSGLAHVLAVSGQNVMLLATLVLATGAALGIGLRSRLLTALALVAVYVPLAGGGPSIQRAGVMGAAGLVAALAGRPGQRWYALTLAAAATLVLNPHVEGEPGWQLSFAAVVALLALGRPLRELLARRLPGAVADAAAVTLAATLGTAPLMALHFERLSLVSLPANLVAAPAVAPVMWLGMLAAAVAQASPALAVPLNTVAAPLLAYVSWIAHVSARAPFAVVPLQLSSPFAAVGGFVLIAAVVAGVVRRSRNRPPSLRRRRGRASRLAAVAGAAAALAVVATIAGRGVTARGAAPRPGELVVSFLDVGQGDATLLQRDGAAILVDTGPPDGPILTRLRAAGVHRLDALVLTHAQADHEGAAIAVLRAEPTRLVVDGGAGWRSPVQRALPTAAAADGARAIVPHAGETLAVGGMRLRILWPLAPATGWRPLGDPNQRAVVALLEAGRFRLLLTADAESDVTGALDLPAVDVLKVAHHGSADPGLPALLMRLQPRLAVIEVGRHNPYGHPAPATLAALRAVPEVLRTDRDGTVRVRIDGGSMRIERAGRAA
jgi:competence protein ComEC